MFIDKSQLTNINDVIKHISEYDIYLSVLTVDFYYSKNSGLEQGIIFTYDPINSNKTIHRRISFKNSKLNITHLNLAYSELKSLVKKDIEKRIASDIRAKELKVIEEQITNSNTLPGISVKMNNEETGTLTLKDIPRQDIERLLKIYNAIPKIKQMLEES